MYKRPKDFQYSLNGCVYCPCINKISTKYIVPIAFLLTVLCLCSLWRSNLNVVYLQYVTATCIIQLTLNVRKNTQARTVHYVKILRVEKVNSQQRIDTAVDTQ